MENGNEKEKLWIAINKIEVFKSELEKPQDSIERIDINTEIASKLISKILSVYDRNQFEHGDLVRNISSLRYIFEALIQSRLLLKEAEYPYQLYLAIHKIQEEQIENHIDRLEREISLFESLEKEDSTQGVELGKTLAEQYSTIDEYSIKHVGEQFFKQMKQLDEKMNSHITIWSENAETNGYGFQAMVLRTRILPEYKKRQEELKKIGKRREIEMVNNGYFNLFFETKGQPTKVFKVINDNRSWAKKAADVELEDEYKFIYSYTSALMHCTSYSFMTPSVLSDDELSMLYKLSEQYINQILTSLRELNTGVRAFILDMPRNKWDNVTKEIKKSANYR